MREVFAYSKGNYANDLGVFRFKAIAGLVRETKESTKASLETLCKI